MIDISYHNYDIGKDLDSVIQTEFRNKLNGIYKFATDQFIDQELHLEILKLKDEFQHFVIVGMGGSFNNPYNVANFLNIDNVDFLYSTDPLYIIPKLQKLNIKETAFIFISKSGKTKEVLALYDAIISFYKELPKAIVITEGESSPLALRAKSNDYQILPHAAAPGRFAAFSIITYIVLLINTEQNSLEEFCKGGAEALSDFLEGKNNKLPDAAHFITDSYKDGFFEYVSMIYSPNLRGYNSLKTQVIAESLGKDSASLMPYPAEGPSDEHSQAERFLGGMQNKLYDLIIIKNQSDVTSPLQELNYAQFQHICGILQKHNARMRVIEIEYSLKALGYLTQSMLLETLLVAELLNINPLGQPNVERLKSQF